MKMEVSIMDAPQPIAPMKRSGIVQVRQNFLLFCALGLLLFLLPSAVTGHRCAQLILAILSALAVAFGWVFYGTHREPNQKWRDAIAVIAGVCLTACVPTLFFEFSPFKWFMQGHRWPSFYVRPWVHWGDALIFLGIAGTFLGRGRARVAFAVAGILMLILWISMPRWVF
jgi:hypothetical protein